ncbi:MAG: hypothetical protein AAF311_14895 [Pseudomonadota bacterium]
MADQNTSNGGGYGNPGAEAQSDYQARAQASDTPSPSATMADDFHADGHVSTLAGLTDGDMDARPQAHNTQSQIAYDAEEE